MKDFKPRKRRKKECIVFNNDGTSFKKYIVQKTVYEFNIFLFIPFLLSIYLIGFAIGMVTYEDLCEFSTLDEAKAKIDEFIDKEKQIWLKKESYTEKKYIKYP
jgi:hypothetical protein